MAGVPRQVSDSARTCLVLDHPIYAYLAVGLGRGVEY
nr:MAG TPA: hypothetical protein [Caudoviricetes sp.]